MSFEFPQFTGILKHTTEKGQLYSVSDTTAQHTVGSKYYDDKNDKTYVYAKNAAAATLATNKPYSLQHAFSSTGDNWKVYAVASDTSDIAERYICVPASALTTDALYGWVQVQGNVLVDGSDTDVFDSEAWVAAGSGLEYDGTTINTQALETTGTGIIGTVFAYTITSAAAGSDLDDAEIIHLIGKPVVNLST